MLRTLKAKPVDLAVILAELLEQFGSRPRTAEAINAAALALKKALIERALGGEMNHHLGYPSGGSKPETVTNQQGQATRRTPCLSTRACSGIARWASYPERRTRGLTASGPQLGRGLIHAGKKGIARSEQ
jgi:hypothetical protein